MPPNTAASTTSAWIPTMPKVLEVTEFSTAVTATTEKIVPGAPILSIRATTTNSVTIQWNDTPGNAESLISGRIPGFLRIDEVCGRTFS